MIEHRVERRPHELRQQCMDSGDTRRVLRVRAFVDSIPPHRCQLAVEAVYRRIADPSQPGREEEILVAPGSRPDSLTHAILADLRQRFGK